MKRLCLSLMMASILGACASAAPVKMATTIDFLDYAFYHHQGPKDHLSLETYEQIIRQLAEGGIKKLYLRVNANGLTLYPTKLSKLYGTDGDCHFFDMKGSQRLVNTLKHYDPLAETVRLGHKYGMEVWAWESLMDDSGPEYFYGNPAEGSTIKAKHLRYTLLDPYFRANPDGYAQLDPRLDMDDAKLDAINRQALAHPIAKILIQNQVTGRPPVRITKEDIQLLTSQDNRHYQVYQGDFTYQCGTNDKNQNYLIIDGLKLRAAYVKIQLKRSFPQGDRHSGYTIGINQARGLCQAYNTKGEPIHTVWSTVLDSKNNDHVPFSFTTFLPAALDSFWNKRQAGFKVGEIRQERYYYGIAEFTVPKTKAYKLARFKELTPYGFDGFMFNLRTHSYTASPNDYGFNPSLRAIYKQKYGTDIYTEPYDNDKLQAIRFQAIADFIHDCRKATNGRPLYVNALKQKPDHYARKYGRLQWNWNTLVQNKAVDGIVLLGTDDYRQTGLTDENARKVKLGLFRELGFPPQGYDFDKDLDALKKRQDIDEVELYESMVLTQHPKRFEKIKD